MAKCEIKNREQLIDDYIRGELSQEAINDFDEHCFSCDECFEELMLQEEAVGVIKKDGQVVFADYLKKRAVKSPHRLKDEMAKLKRLFTPDSRWAYAFALIAVLIIFSVVAYNRFGSQETQNYFAGNFEESANLEDMIGQVFRSSYSLNVVSPEIGANLAGPIVFEWEISYDGEVDLQILSNKEDILSDTKTTLGRHRLEENELSPGLYYWKLQTADRLLFVGKFFVDKPN